MARGNNKKATQVRGRKAVPEKRRRSRSPSTSSESEDDDSTRSSTPRVTQSIVAPVVPCQALAQNLQDLSNAAPLLGLALNYSPGDGGDPFGNNNSVRPEVIDKSISLASVGGLEDQVIYIRQNILYPMEHLADFAAWGIEPIKGIIFHGPPGTGKSLLAKALVSELANNGKNVKFFMMKGSDCLSKWVGESEKNIREVFRVAQSMKPSIIFIDELDGLCPSRQDSTHQIYTSIVTTLLGQIDTIKRGEVFLIAATNRLDSIDPALKRPGRFDKALAFLPPNLTGRREILNIFLNKWNSNKPAANIIDDLAQRTVGFTGADLEQLCRDAFNFAMNRQMPGIGKPGNSGKNCHLKDLKVNEADWDKALSNIGRSNSNVFGNSIYTGDMVDPIMKPLLSGIVTEITQRIQKFLHTENTISDPTCKGTGIQSLLVYGSSVATVDIIDTRIFPGVMASFDAEKTPGFILSERTLGKTPLNKSLEQVNECRKSCFLFIPRIDKLWASLVKAGTEDMFRLGIEMIRTTNVVLIASSTVQLSNFPDDLRTMFRGIDRSYSMRKPNLEERREFFSSIFDPTSNFMQNAMAAGDKKSSKAKGFEGKLKTLACRAEKSTQDDEIKCVFSLHGELAMVCMRNAEGTRNDCWDTENLLKQFGEVLDKYETDKLDH